MLRAAKFLIGCVVPPTLIDWYRTRLRRAYRIKNAGRSLQEVFREIYETNLWGGKKGFFCSGPGSEDSISEPYVSFIRKFLLDHGHEIHRVVDLGCGDFRVGRRISMNEINYVGIDVVPDLVGHLQLEFGSEVCEFRCLDITSDDLPDADLCLIRQVLQHLSNYEIKRVLENTRKYKYVFITEHLPSPKLFRVPNIDKVHGVDVRIQDDSGVFLDQPPFSLTGLRKVLEVPLPHPFRHEGESVTTFLIENTPPSQKKASIA